MTSASPPLFAPSHLLVGRAVSPGYVSVTTHGLRWVCTLRRSQPFPSFSRLSANLQPTHVLFSPQATHLRLRLVGAAGDNSGRALAGQVGPCLLFHQVTLIIPLASAVGVMPYCYDQNRDTKLQTLTYNDRRRFSA